MGDNRQERRGFTLSLAPRVLLVLAIGSVLVSMVVTHLARVESIQRQTERQMDRVERVARSLADRVAPLLQAEDDLRLAMLGASVAQFGEYRVLIVDAKGMVRLDSGLALGGKKLQLLTAEGPFARSVDEGRREYLAPASGLEGLVGEVRIGFPVVAAASVGYSVAMFGGCLLACLSILGIIGLICHHWTSSLREAVTTAHRLVRGDLSARCVRRAGGVVREMQDSLHDLGAVLGAGAQQVEQSFLELALQSVEVLERRGKVGHGERTRTYAAVLTRRLGLSPEDCRDVDTAARIHDLGEVFESPQSGGSEDAGAELGHLRRLPQRGAELIAGIANLRRIAEIVRHHRECYDGSGFPSALRGDRIPLGARIVGIADAYDQLTTVVRGDQPPLRWNEALGVLREDRGTTFDPWLVDLFEEEIRKSPMPRRSSDTVMVANGGAVSRGVAPYKVAQGSASTAGEDDEDTLYWSEDLEIEVLGEDGPGGENE